MPLTHLFTKPLDSLSLTSILDQSYSLAKRTKYKLHHDEEVSMGFTQPWAKGVPAYHGEVQPTCIMALGCAQKLNLIEWLT